MRVELLARMKMEVEEEEEMLRCCSQDLACAAGC